MSLNVFKYRLSIISFMCGEKCVFCVYERFHGKSSLKRKTMKTSYHAIKNGHELEINIIINLNIDSFQQLND